MELKFYELSFIVFLAFFWGRNYYLVVCKFDVVIIIVSKFYGDKMERFVCHQSNLEVVIVAFLNLDRSLEMKLLIPRIVIVVEIAVARYYERIFVARQGLIECRPGVLCVVAGTLQVVVVATGIVKEYLAFPGCGVTHVEAAFHLGVETAVGKGTAPVLVNVEGNQVLLAIQLDESLLLFGQQNVFGIVPSVDDVAGLVCLITCAFINKLAVEVVLGGGVVVSAGQIDGTGKQLVGGEGTANIDVSHNAFAGPLIGGTSVERRISTEGGCVLLPHDG